MNNFFEFLKKHRWLSSIYIIWAFLNIILFLRNPTFNNDGATFIFNPFTNVTAYQYIKYDDNNRKYSFYDSGWDGISEKGTFIDHYDFAELVFHLSFPLVCLILYKLNGADIIAFYRKKIKPKKSNE